MSITEDIISDIQAGVRFQGLTNKIEKTGQLPKVSLEITNRVPKGESAKSFSFDKFISYSFKSSVIVPIDTFTFTTVIPDDTGSIRDKVNEGDTAILKANGSVIGTGIIDRIEIEFEMGQGERVTFSGRNLLAQLEDQDAISVDSTPLYASNMTPTQIANFLIQDTLIPGVVLTSDAPTQAWIVGSEPHESKLSVLTRYCEPLNIIVWMTPDGSLKIGRPDFLQATSGKIFCIKKNRQANVTSIRASFASTQIPNLWVPIWVNQEGIQSRVSASQGMLNKAAGPARLYKLGYRLPKAVVVSTPQGAKAQDFPSLNDIIVAGGGTTLLQNSAQREGARANVNEVIVHAVVPGHYNEFGAPFIVDTTYNISFDRAKIEEKMYLYSAEYSLDPQSGQRTNLEFCRLNTIVSNVRVK